MKTILHPTDFSPHAETALDHAIGFARAYDAELHLLNVQIPFSLPSFPVEETAAEAEAHSALDALRIDGVRVERTVRRGLAPAPAIIEHADEIGADLLVMGSHGRRGVRRLLLGSVTEEVVREGRGPVLTVHEESKAPEGGYARILVPVDFSPRTAPQLEMAADLARRFDSALDVVHVIDPPTMPDLYVPFERLVVDIGGTTEKALEKLGQLTAGLEQDFDVTTQVLVGRAAPEISEHAGSSGADLIVMPTHGHSGLDRVLLGSVAEGVLRRAECPVLVLKPAD